MALIGSESRDRLAADPSPRLRLGTFNGRRPSRESLIGNGVGTPPVSRFLYRPHYRRTKSESQGFLKQGSVRVDFNRLFGNCSVFRTRIHARMRAALRDFAIWEGFHGV
jgi:hypothetical protein